MISDVSDRRYRARRSWSPLPLPVPTGRLLAPPAAPARPAPPLPLRVEEVPEPVGLVAVDVVGVDVLVVGDDVLVVGDDVLVVGVDVLVVGVDVLVVGDDVLVVVGLGLVVVEVGVLVVVLVEVVAGVVELEVVGVVVEFVRHARLATAARVLAPWLRLACRVAFTDGGRWATALLNFATALFVAAQLPALTADETASS